MKKNSNRYCVIMCGGVGSRFWPFSRNEKPKQFLDFFGTGRSLLQMTVDRILPLIGYENIILVSNEAYADIIRSQLPEIKEENILLEPARRNTAPCVCWAARHIWSRNPEGSMVILPADHLILREDNFRSSIEEGFDFVEQDDALLTLGLKPSEPHTGYGYIQEGKPVKNFPGISKVKSFTEKPAYEMARLFVDSGEFFWNAGIFLWKAKTVLDAFSQYAPEIFQTLEAPAETYVSPEKEKEFIKEAFPQCINISVDYAIMERVDNVYVKRVNFGWSDLGSWKALYDSSPTNADGNVTQGCKVLTQDCKGSLFAVNGDKIIVAAGLNDYIVADNGNALLIFPKNEEQKIRNIVNDVKNRFGEKFI